MTHFGRQSELKTRNPGLRFLGAPDRGQCPKQRNKMKAYEPLSGILLLDPWSQLVSRIMGDQSRGLEGTSLGKVTAPNKRHRHTDLREAPETALAHPLKAVYDDLAISKW